MKRRFERKLSMYEVVQDRLANHSDPAILNQMPQFVEYRHDFDQVVAKIKDAVAEQIKQRSGVSADKQAARDAAVGLGIKISLAVRAYAINGGNNSLANLMGFSRSRMGRYADNILKGHLKDIAAAATENLPALADYHVDAALISELEAATAAFDNWIPKPRTEIVARHNATELLEALFAQGDLQLSRMDVLTELVAESSPEFYQTFKSSRMLVDAGYRRLALRGVVRDSNGMPVERAVIELNGKPMRNLTTVRGNFQFRQLPAGIYEIVIRKNGYKSAQMTVGINDNERTDVKLEMMVME